MTMFFVVLGLALLWALNQNRKKSNSDAYFPSTAGRTWVCRFCKGLPDYPKLTAGGWVSDIPSQPQFNINDVAWVQGFPSPVGKSKITMRFAIAGDATYTPWESPSSEALVSLMIRRRGDNMSAQGPYRTYRYYTKDAVPMAPGVFELSAPLQLDAWCPVEYAGDEASFHDLLADMESINVIFGYNGGRAHGVYGSAPSTFELLELRVD